MKTFLLKVAGYRRRQTEVQANEPAVILPPARNAAGRGK